MVKGYFRNKIPIFALTMNIEPKEIQHIYAQHPGVDALMQLREEGGKKHAFLEGLFGSSAAMVLCGLKQRAPEQTMLITESPSACRDAADGAAMLLREQWLRRKLEEA